MTRMSAMALAGLVASALAVVGARSTTAAPQTAGATLAPAHIVPPLDADLTPLTSKNLVGHRLWIILFDTSAMRLEDVQHAAAQALTWSGERTANVDVMAVAVIGSTGLEVLQDFTSNDAKIRRALAAFSVRPGEADAAAPDLGAITNDARFTGLKTLCDALKAWEDRKEMLYFSAGGAPPEGDNRAQYRDAINACEKAHVTIDPIDARGLTAGGPGATPGRTGAAAPARGAGGSGVTGTRSSEPPAMRPDFAGTWRGDVCPATLRDASNAVWLGQTFTISYTPADQPTSIVVRPLSPDSPIWTFDLTGARGTNAVAAPLAGVWASDVSWKGDTLVMTMAGTVEQNGHRVPVVMTQALSIDATGPSKGDLRVITTSAPEGLLPGGVCMYKKTARPNRP